MLKTLKQARAAFGMLNPEEVRQRSAQPVHVGLVAASDAGYAELEQFLVPRELDGAERIERMAQVHRAGDPDAPPDVSIVLYEDGLQAPRGAYSHRRFDPDGTVADVLRNDADLDLALARQFPVFRKAVIDRIIHMTARENALFSIATALPNVLPNLMELPWAFSEFASDTAFITANQVRMAFQIAAALGHPVGFAEQKGAVLTIIGSAFGWRALARELAGKIPLGEGLIPKGAIAYAGTYVVGKGLHKFANGEAYSSAERRLAYREALEHGRTLTQAAERPA